MLLRNRTRRSMLMQKIRKLLECKQCWKQWQIIVHLAKEDIDSNYLALVVFLEKRSTVWNIRKLGVYGAQLCFLNIVKFIEGKICKWNNYLAELHITMKSAMPKLIVRSRWTGKEQMTSLLNQYLSANASVGPIEKWFSTNSPKYLISRISQDGCHPYKNNTSFNGCVIPQWMTRKNVSIDKKILILSIKSSRYFIIHSYKYKNLWMGLLLDILKRKSISTL